MPYFIGGDLGGTKTHMLIVDQTGHALGLGQAGCGNHQSVGFDGMYEAMRDSLEQAMQMSGVSIKDVAGSGFGIGGYDWPSEEKNMAAAIRRLGMQTPIRFVNDAVPGLVAGAEEGWGVAIVSGTGCNCRGWDKEHRREGRMTGYGVTMGEGAGGTELMHRCMIHIGWAWTRRGPQTALTEAIIKYAGAKDVDDLLEGYTETRYAIGADAAPLVFEVAAKGDQVARQLIHWAGCELGEMANAVIRQLDIQNLAFDVVLTGGMFKGGPLLIDPMRETIHNLAPKARLVRLTTLPVVGAAMIGLEIAGVRVTPEIRKNLISSVAAVQGLPVQPAEGAAAI